MTIKQGLMIFFIILQSKINSLQKLDPFNKFDEYVKKSEIWKFLVNYATVKNNEHNITTD